MTTKFWRLGSRSSPEPEDAWEQIARAMEVSPEALIRVHQVHGMGIVVRRPGAAAAQPLQDADIIISSDPAVAIAVQAADCVPLLIADQSTGVVAAAHAGWRGLSIRVASMTVAALRREFGSKPADLVAAIGPSVGACCYEVGRDVYQRFLRSGATQDAMARWFHQRPQPTRQNPSMAGLGPPREEHWYFDGWAAAREQLRGAGVPEAQIHTAEVCTASHPDTLCSFRRDGAPAGRIAAAIRMRG
jgi:YfiH family protein